MASKSYIPGHPAFVQHRMDFPVVHYVEQTLLMFRSSPFQSFQLIYNFLTRKQLYSYRMLS